MKNLFLLTQIAYLIIFIVSCDSNKQDDLQNSQFIFEDIKTHRQGHGADPPPCTGCEDLVGNPNPTANSPVQSFQSYGFLLTYKDSIHLYYLYPKALSNDMPSSNEVYFKAPDHYIIDVDTTSKGEVLKITTGIKIKIANQFSTSMSPGYIKGYKVDESQLRTKANKLNIAGLGEAGYISDSLGQIYLAQDYYYLADLGTLKKVKIWSHIEKMQLFIDTAYQDKYSIDLAVDIQLNHLKLPHHVFGDHPHNE